MGNSNVNEELSWLQFNLCVFFKKLEDESIPLIERLRFSRIFSNNLDEFKSKVMQHIKRIDLAGRSA
jgi:polyphosphate kinase